MTDPLQGIDSQPVDVQVGRLITEARNLRGAIHDVDQDVLGMKRALYALVFTILAGMIVFLVTFTVTGG